MPALTSDDPIATLLLATRGKRTLIAYLYGAQAVCVGLVEFVALRVAPHTHDQRLVHDVIWGVPILWGLLEVMNLIQRPAVERRIDRAWRLMAALVVLLVVLQTLTYKP